MGAKDASREEAAHIAALEDLQDPGWAWSEYKPSVSAPWDLARVGHLYRRAGFGANWAQLQEALSQGPGPTIDKLLQPQGDLQAFEREYAVYEGSAMSVNDLRAWWVRRMIQTPHPLLEKMTLFWHGHFAINGENVKNTGAMLQYVRALRGEALGSFRSMLNSVCRDPAVLLGVGSGASRKSMPNDNFAGAMLESFTVGPAVCSQTDVSEAARAFTGWFVLRGKVRYIEREHDGGVKRILGQSGNFTGEDVVRIVLEQDAAARAIVTKLYKYFISEGQEPDAKLIAPLAESFAGDYNILKVVETMLRSNIFFSQAAYRGRIKCPVDFALGIVNAFEGMVSTTHLAEDIAALGQDLYHPPTIRGWPGGRGWISSATMAGRSNLAWSLLGGSKPYGERLDPWAVAQKHGASSLESAAEFLVGLLLGDDAADGDCETLIKTVQAAGGAKPQEQLRRFAYRITSLAEYNLC
ncbi:MAG: DUF1800 domain-containing protein [Sedimentisphaerales bacterium]|nr:DUF1800 domain-containing protein [Sedimentisphaerales bacterium]